MHSPFRKVKTLVFINTEVTFDEGAWAPRVTLLQESI